MTQQWNHVWDPLLLRSLVSSFDLCLLSLGEDHFPTPPYTCLELAQLSTK